jgi:hypothetical protein
MQQHECNKHNYLCINDSLNFLFPCEIRVLQVRSILKLRHHISRCVEVKAQIRVVIVVVCGTSGARRDSIAHPATKFMGHWRRVVHILCNMLPTSTPGHDLTESTLSFLKVEHKHTIKWSFSFFVMTACITYL